MTNEVLVAAEQWPFVQIPTKLLGDESVPGPAKLSYAYLQVWGRSDGKVWASRNKMAKAAKVDRTTFYRHLNALEASGWIARAQEGDKHMIRVKHRLGEVSHQCHTPVDPVPHPQSHQRDTEVEEGNRRKKEKPSRSECPTNLIAECDRLLRSDLNKFSLGLVRSMKAMAEQGTTPKPAQLAKFKEVSAENPARAPEASFGNPGTSVEQLRKDKADNDDGSDWADVMAERAAEKAAKESA